MSIKSDRWIRRMALDHGMIEPFEAGQVRQAGGHRIVSYGTSSYGYDVRCADEFKIFTNINSTIVDPKAFDARNFVDFQGEVCIIPPNSFALARTVEYFRIPRDTLVVCLGKCVTGDTRVVDTETGALLPIRDIRAGTRTLSLQDWAWKQGRVSEFVEKGVQPVFELRTRTGRRIRATGTHPFRQLHGWTALKDLRPGDRIAVARDLPVFGRTPLPDWEATLLGLMISEGQCNTPGHSPTFTTGDPVLADLIQRVMAESGLGVATPKTRYGWRLVNRVGRGGIAERNRAHEWLKRYGLNVNSGEKFVPQRVFMAPREATRIFLRALFSGDGGIYRSGESFYLEYYSKSRRLIEDVSHLLLRFGIFGLVRGKTTAVGTPAWSVQITDREQIARFASEIGFWEGSIKQLRLENEIMPPLRARPRIKSNFDTLPVDAWMSLNTVMAARSLSYNGIGLAIDRSKPVPFATARRVIQATSDAGLEALVNGPLWDVVVSVEAAGEEEVYDISVPGLENFVGNDVVLHNSTYARCGIIVNVTPLEPEWEGHVTLEFSNTTPLPAKIYAGEGCAQMLFFQSDEVCETSYKDRGGKYQGQTGVTLPRT